MVFSTIRVAISAALKALNWDVPNDAFTVQVNHDVSKGEFSSNVAYLVRQHHRQDIKEAAAQIVKAISQTKNPFQHIEVVNGYLNFFYQVAPLNDIIKQILTAGELYGSSTMGKNIRVNYEWISANPTGHLHIGHLRNAVVGDCLVNVFAFMNYEIDREFYINDAGNQIFNLGKSIYYHYAQKLNIPFEVFPDMYQNVELIALAEQIYAKHGNQYRDLSWKTKDDFLDQKYFIDFGKAHFLKVFRDDCQAIGIHFDHWFSEKSSYENDYFEKFQARLQKDNLSYIKDGALWFKVKQFGLEEDFVLIKKDGSPTYFAGDIMYHDNKFTRGYDYIYNLWGADHHGHSLKIKASMKALGWPVERFDVDFLQMVRVLHKEEIQKMSKRAGTAVYWREFVKFTGKDFARFMMISRQRTTKFVFDLSLLREKNMKNPVFYTQYAHARAFQVLAKKKNTISFPKTYQHLGKTPSEKDLIVNLYRFPLVNKRVIEKHEPQILVDYLVEISKKFHVFYQQNPILTAPKSLMIERLGLVAAFRQVAANIFKLIGISAPERM